MIAQESSLRGVAVRVESSDLAGTRSGDGEIAIFKGLPYAKHGIGTRL